jgi:two-component system sensor histidine kinase KdpD
MSEEILAYARARNVSRIVIGKPKSPLWKRIVFGSIVDALIRGSGDIDIAVISGEPEEDVTPKAARARLSAPLEWKAYRDATIAVALCTAVAWGMFPYFALSNLIMVYLLGVTFVASRTGRGPSILASVLSVAAFDFFFVPPFLTFAVSDTQYFVTFGVMLVVAIVISGFTVRIRAQAEAARERERRTAALYALSRELAAMRGVGHILAAAVRHIVEVLGGQVAVLLLDPTGRLAVRSAFPESFELGDNELAVGQWVYDHGEMAGRGSATLPGAQALYLPLVASRGTVGVLGIVPAEPRMFRTPEQLHLLETFANQTALAIERGKLAGEAQEAAVRVEAERLRRLPPQLGLTRPAHTARGDHRGGQQPAGGWGAVRLQDAAGTVASDSGRERVPHPAGAQHPPDDAPGICPGRPQPGMACCGGTGRRGAEAV